MDHRRALVLARLQFPARNFLWCVHFENISLLLFSISFLVAFKIHSFSLSHRLQLLDHAEYAVVRFRMDQLIRNGQLRSLNSHTYFDNSDPLRYLSFHIDFTWFLQRSLKLLAVTPINIFSFALSDVISARYTILLVKHFPLSGHSSFLLQLHMLSRAFGFIFVVRMLLLARYIALHILHATVAYLHCTGVCTTEYHTIFYHSYFMSQVYIMDYYWFFGKVFHVVFLPVWCCG